MDETLEDFGDDEYFDGAEDDADIGDMLALPRQREDRDADDVSVASDGSDVISLNDNDDPRAAEQLQDDLERYRKMRGEKERLKVVNCTVYYIIHIITLYCHILFIICGSR